MTWYSRKDLSSNHGLNLRKDTGDGCAQERISHIFDFSHGMRRIFKLTAEEMVELTDGHKNEDGFGRDKWESELRG